MADNLQYFEKTKNGYLRKLLGEICTDFNFGFVIDGGKDSALMTYVSYTKLNLKPYTIVYHQKTNSWWVIADDTYERYENESGYFYMHKVSLLGAIEVLNTKDLTDMSCYGKRYTLLDICNKIKKLTPFYDFPTFEFNVHNNCINLNKKIDYTKSFQNYTMLSALRELFDGYNCALKMSFAFNNTTGYITHAYIEVFPKTGDRTRTHNESVFNDIREKKEINKSNYGTSVISNSQNVVAQNNKTYPSGGAAKISSNSYNIDRKSCFVRLPSPVYEVNWVKMIFPAPFEMAFSGETQKPNDIDLSLRKNITYYGVSGKQLLINELNRIKDTYNGTYDDLFEQIIEDIDLWFGAYNRACSVPFYANSTYNATTDRVVAPAGHDNPYFYLGSTSDPAPKYFSGNVGLVPKEVRDGMLVSTRGIGWERGKDTIGAFEFLANAGTNEVCFLSGFDKTELTSEDVIRWESNNQPVIFEKEYTFTIEGSADTGITTLKLYGKTDNSLPLITDGNYHISNSLTTSNARFIINYVPMADIKVVYDTNAVDRVGKLYNQTGKTTSANGLSKLMVSHVREIQSPKLVKYGFYYDYDDVPKVGDRVVIDNDIYVVGSTSLDFMPNEEEQYEINAEFTLSLSIATKSLLTEANSAIRDYNIPQNINVKRIQLYKDFYELSHTQMDLSNTSQKLNLNRVLNLGYTYQPYQEHKAIMKLSYEYLVDGQESWYYQLDTIVYTMKKAVYEVVDFKDNNIIGYDSMNTNSGFLVQEIFTHRFDNVNTPISYVDNYGEVADFEIAFCNMDQVANIYSDYLSNTSGGSAYDGDLINYSVFIDSKIYEGDNGVYTGAKVRNDFMITEIDYKKDTTEVPVFEYVCQLDDSDDVIVGEDIFNTSEEDIVYFYAYYFADKGTVNENNYSTALANNVEEILENKIFECQNVCVLSYSGNLQYRKIKIELKTKGTYNNGTMTYSSNGFISTTQDLVIVRKAVSKGYTVQSVGGDTIVNTKDDLFMIVRNMENAQLVGNNAIEININWFETK